MNINVAVKRLSLLQVLEPSGGGSGRHFLDLCRAMQHRGHSVTAVYSPLRAEAAFVAELEGMGLDSVIPLAMRRAPGPWDLTAWWNIRRIAARYGPFHLIHGHSSKAGALTRLRLPGPHVPVIYTPHAFRTMDPTLDSKGRTIYGGIERLLGSRLSDRLICVSRDEYDHARSLGIPEVRLRIVVNGVSAPPSGQRAAIRVRYGIPQDALLFGFVGRLTRQKAPERLIQAFARIAKELPRAHLLMIGVGELADTVKDMIKAAGLEDRAHLDDAIPGAAAIDAFDVVVMPSRYEAMSYVMLEAAAGGKPLLLTDVGGARTVIEPGRNGYIVANSDDPSELAMTMRRFADPKLLRNFTAEARQRKDGYTLAGMADATEEIYFELLGYRAPAPLRRPERIMLRSAS
ncbi:glycosyltransferase family 4 protein [Agrobacterium sp. SHOUNA12C]|uniref:glycosyltransferase family 4 protein n=1 Tax=Rhizobium rhizogenes TaxID=359 RepID=UPI00056CEEA5|nr:glycosyltransferase family 4 protein [Rhizobium rhizogenes]MCJ9721758.1 glycosyltransferase family 4 protein [Agrobacterium sp. BETTINA12B]MCJ9757899.1 glycosyltransferase family 4 protein [Agrobacterium sp. SHOUNA12C]OCJ06501.1 glycosyl transferase [Agrobacterium sp. 13-626]NTF80709.1 glycosyltransferase family 4 protein [Rhizobium rhizogenes]NTG85899.1 glycosyltransferase family 4 protein [Rhizobium rhizogenes]